ncbi:MAG: O-antigen ligase family protein, partial [Candidatus Promineifilaceae bacterium]
ALLRAARLKAEETWHVIDAFVLGGLVVAAIGLWQYVTGQNLITGEGGLMRLRSIYGSPNNAALYLGRMVPILVAMSLMGRDRRRLAYALSLIPVGAAIVLTFSKGSLFLGVPASLAVVFVLWRHSVGGRIWPWLMGAVAVGAGAILLLLRIPQLAARLNLQGSTSFFRLSLWQASLNMFVEHPVFGVGLDNFLYAYRSRYIFRDAWQEPNLSHPHNIFLDFATRLGIVGLLTGGWMFWNFLRIAWRLPRSVSGIWRPIAVGILGSLVYMLVHGLVDHSFFLVDLAFSFYLLFGIAVWLGGLGQVGDPAETSPVDRGYN